MRDKLSIGMVLHNSSRPWTGPMPLIWPLGIDTFDPLDINNKLSNTGH